MDNVTPETYAAASPTTRAAYDLVYADFYFAHRAQGDPEPVARAEADAAASAAFCAKSHMKEV